MKPFFRKESFTKNLSFKKKALPKKHDYFCFAKTAYRLLVKCYFTKINLFWIKPFSKRFDVSILVFVDGFCNPSPFLDFSSLSLGFLFADPSLLQDK